MHTFVQRGTGRLLWSFNGHGTRGQHNWLRDHLLDPIHHPGAERWDFVTDLFARLTPAVMRLWLVPNRWRCGTSYSLWRKLISQVFHLWTLVVGRHLYHRDVRQGVVIWRELHIIIEELIIIDDEQNRRKNLKNPEVLNVATANWATLWGNRTFCSAQLHNFAEKDTILFFSPVCENWTKA